MDSMLWLGSESPDSILLQALVDFYLDRSFILMAAIIRPALLGFQSEFLDHFREDEIFQAVLGLHYLGRLLAWRCGQLRFLMVADIFS